MSVIVTAAAVCTYFATFVMLQAFMATGTRLGMSREPNPPPKSFHECFAIAVLVIHGLAAWWLLREIIGN